MTMSGQRLRSIGWLALLGLCSAAALVLTLRVNALKSEVRRAENRIVALKQETLYLQTEYKTRANQQQLRAWNDVDFGYSAPTAGQYLENERQLAALGTAVGPDAPAPVQVAAAETVDHGGSGFPAMVNPLTGKVLGETASDTPARGAVTELSHVVSKLRSSKHADGDDTASGLSARLGRIDREDSDEAPAKKPAKAKAKPAGKKADEKKAPEKKATEKKAGDKKAGDKKAAERKAASSKKSAAAKSASHPSPSTRTASKREPAA